MMFDDFTDSSNATITISSSQSNGGYGAAETSERDNENTVYANTLGEPVLDTILRDLKMISYKMKYVMLPKMNEERGKQLRNCNSICFYRVILRGFMGSVTFVSLFSLVELNLFLNIIYRILSFSSSNQSDIIFGTIFVVIWLGAGILTLNAKLLQGNISFFQSICVLGYCVCPIALISLFLAILPFPPLLCFIGLLGACFWSCYSSIGFMAALVKEEKKILAVYPIILFYLFLSWFSFITLC